MAKILDRALAREIKKESNGDGSREAKFTFAKKIRETARDLSTPEVMHGAFERAIKAHGRVPVAICVASTLLTRQEHIDRSYLNWAREVCGLWTNKSPNWQMNSRIDDNLHPSRICEYAGSFIWLTSVEADDADDS